MAKNSSINNDTKMKLIVFGALIVAFLGGYLVARAKYKPQIISLNQIVAEKDAQMKKITTNANRVVMKDGKMWLVEEGVVKSMDSDLMLSNGTKVMTDGKVVAKDGEEMMMQNGDAVDMEGKMMTNGGTDVDTSTSN